MSLVRQLLEEASKPECTRERFDQILNEFERPIANSRDALTLRKVLFRAFTTDRKVLVHQELLVSVVTA